MLSEPIRKVVEQFKRLMLEEGVPVRAVTVFGSQARGDADEESDIDVLVVVDRIDPSIREAIWHCAWKAEFGPGFLIQPVTVTKDSIDRGIRSSSLLMTAVRTEGIPVE